MRIMPVRKKDTTRALGLLEEYCCKLRKPEEQLLKTAIQRVMVIFQSNLFEALLDIQEFYEVTLLNTQKSHEQKLEEVNTMVDKWGKGVNPPSPELTQSPCPAEEELVQREPSSLEPSGTGQAEGSVKTSEGLHMILDRKLEFLYNSS